MEHEEMPAAGGLKPQLAKPQLAKPQLERLVSPCPPPETGDHEPAPMDAWLERRLRVFERALHQLEARHEKTERELTRRIALLEERIALCEKGADVPSAPEDTNSTVAAEAHVVTAPATMQPPKQIGDVLDRARRAANAAAIVPASSPKHRGAPRWMAWAAVGCAAAMTVTGLALGNVAGASEPVGATSHRHAASAFGRVIALADSGDPQDQTLLALDYLRGQHVASDHQAAGRWALAAAEEGDPRAQYLIGAFYQAGDGVAADPARAFHWFETAALGGNLKAMHNLAIAYAEGQGTERNDERAAAWFNRAAQYGYTDSQFDLAVLYERGDGVKQNPQGALKWYLIAARAGDKEAASRATELEQAMAASDVSEANMAAGAFVAQMRDPVANRL